MKSEDKESVQLLLRKNSVNIGVLGKSCLCVCVCVCVCWGGEGGLNKYNQGGLF